jgi:hypothetical protein
MLPIKSKLHGPAPVGGSVHPNGNHSHTSAPLTRTLPHPQPIQARHITLDLPRQLALPQLRDQGRRVPAAHRAHPLRLRLPRKGRRSTRSPSMGSPSPATRTFLSTRTIPRPRIGSRVVRPPLPLFCISSGSGSGSGAAAWLTIPRVDALRQYLIQARQETAARLVEKLSKKGSTHIVPSELLQPVIVIIAIIALAARATVMMHAAVHWPTGIRRAAECTRRLLTRDTREHMHLNTNAGLGLLLLLVLLPAQAADPTTSTLSHVGGRSTRASTPLCSTPQSRARRGRPRRARGRQRHRGGSAARPCAPAVATGPAAVPPAPAPASPPPPTPPCSLGRGEDGAADEDGCSRGWCHRRPGSTPRPPCRDSKSQMRGRQLQRRWTALGYRRLHNTGGLNRWGYRCECGG